MQYDIKNTTVGNYRISWDDSWHRLDINGCRIHLSPTQYRICHAFLSHSTPSTISGELIILAYRNQHDLQCEVEMPSRHLLTKHVSVLNGRINTHGLHIHPFHERYALTASVMASVASLRSIR